jgi:DNA repair exonuclease SbcCD ATPase subunit
MSADLAALEQRVRHQRRITDQLSGQAQEVGRRGLLVQEEIAQLEALGEQCERVIRLLSAIGEARQDEARKTIEELVTRALQVIFDENLSFHLVPGTRANQATLDFMVRSEYVAGDEAGVHHDAPVLVDTPVLEARGGGMAVVVSFVLRMLVLMLTPGARRVMFLDESFSHVSAEYEPRLAEFLREVCDKGDMQILLVTHSSAYSDLADVVYRLKQGPDGVTTAEKLGED